MRTSLIARLGLLMIAGLLGLCLLACNRSKPDPTARLTRQRDSLQHALNVCQGQALQLQAQYDYEQIARSPASSWPDSVIKSYLSNPYHLHPQGAGGPQRR